MTNLKQTYRLVNERNEKQGQALIMKAFIKTYQSQKMSLMNGMSVFGCC